MLGTNEPISIIFEDSMYADNGGMLIFKFYEISSSNTAPTTEDINISIDENRMSKTITDITLQGSDIDGDDLTYSLVSTSEAFL